MTYYEYTASEQGLALLRRFEGCELKPYLCLAGKWTIGYGRTIPEEIARQLGPIDMAQAEAWLREDAEKAAAALTRHVKPELRQNRADALISFVFNVGEAAFRRSTLLKCLNTRQFPEAEKEFSRWIYAGGRVFPGLVARREAEAALFRGGK